MPENQTDGNGNPLLVNDGLPPFDKIAPEHVVPAVRAVLAEAQSRLEAVEGNVSPTWEGTIEPLDELGRPFEYAWAPVTHFFGVKNSTELRTAHETVLPEVVAFSLRAKQSEPIYRALKNIRDGKGWSSLDEAQRRIVDRKLLSVELAGIALTGEKRDRFNEIVRELSKLSTDYSNHVLDATKAFSLTITNQDDVAGLPPSLRQLAAQAHNDAKSAGKPEATPDAGPWRITLEAPSFVPFMQHCRTRALREAVYRAFILRASQGELDNTAIISRILLLRREQAQLLGYKSFAELSLADKMAPDVDAVFDMFDALRSASWDAAQKDMQDVRSLASQNGFQQPLAHWDVAFWAERLREKRFDYTDEQLRPYFPLERVLDGLFSLVQHLFGITVRAADGKAPVWHKDVRFFEVLNEDGRQIAAFYLDQYSRPKDKRGGAWMDECLSRRWIDGKLRLPVAHLVCNATPPVGSKPSLMTFTEVETLFHEFGHGLQHMLTTVDYPDAAGISGVEWDAVELASQFMENWCYHKPTLQGLSRHFETGAPLPDELFHKIQAARTYRAGSLMLRQLLFGMTDMELHGRFDPAGSETPFDAQRRLSEKTSVLPVLPEDRSLCAFSHIFAGGYAAGYYSYKWAEVLSADAFSAFEEAGLDNEKAIREIGRRYRDTILALGGGRHPMDVYRDFRGREPNPEALLRHSGLLTRESA